MRRVLFMVAAVLSSVPSRLFAADQTQIEVFAAASLTESFTEIGKQLEAAHHGVKVVFTFGGSNQLRSQLELGARADVFASANTQEMDRAIQAKLIAGAAVKVFARNRLLIIFPKDNPCKIGSLADLAKPGLKLALAHKAVPVGKYALEMLDRASEDPGYGPAFKERVLANVVSEEENVKAIVVKVRLGVAAAGVVYVSDVTPAAAKELGALEIPKALNPVAEYPLAPLAKAPQPQLANEFVAAVLGPVGQAALRKSGFVPVDENK